MILYHGTSKKRLQRILADNCLKANTIIEPSVCMSSRYEPALYWANMSAWTDTSSPVIIRFEAMALLDNWYSLIPYSDPVWGEGRCDWEREVRTNEDIYPLSDAMEGFDDAPWTDVRKKCPMEILKWCNKTENSSSGKGGTR